MNIGIILLAAGSSSRLGRSKQLIIIDHEPLLVRSVKTALESNASHVMVVLGFEQQLHRKIIQPLPVTIIHNSEWEKGMGSSLKVGLTKLLSLVPDIDAAIAMVCDQPLLTAEHLNNLIFTYTEAKCEAVASVYSDTVGTPALFDRSLFKKIMSTEDGAGAKRVIDQSLSVKFVPFDHGALDLDTPEDYQSFLKTKKPS